jgi:hypothetical protein
MILVGRPEQRDQQVGIKKTRGHWPSVSSRRTWSVVTRGDSGGSLKTIRPLRSWDGVGALRPRRTSSETAFPKDKPRAFAWRATSSTMSSSSVKVVRIDKKMLLFKNDVNSTKVHHLSLGESRHCHGSPRIGEKRSAGRPRPAARWTEVGRTKTIVPLAASWLLRAEDVPRSGGRVNMHLLSFEMKH